MSKVTIYHNPRCSKSRQTLALLEEKGISPQIVQYLENPLSADEVRSLLEKLGMGARDLIRKKEKEYRELGLDDTSLSEDRLVKAISTTPRLMERPVVVKGKKAAIGRPPENVLDIL